MELELELLRFQGYSGCHTLFAYADMALATWANSSCESRTLNSARVSSIRVVEPLIALARSSSGVVEILPCPG